MRAIAVVILLSTHVGATPTKPVATIGTAHPIWIQDYARDARWLISCEARTDTDGKPGTAIETSLHGDYGDLAKPWLIWGSGTGDRIDAFANQSPNGRWFAIVRGGALELYDAQTRKHEVLAGANLDDDASSTPSSRLTSFGDERMLYFRSSHGRDVVVIRELETGAERVVDIPGVVWRAEIDPAGRWAKVRVVRTDTNQDGKLTWPSSRGSFGLRSCFQGDPHMFWFRPTDGDDPVTVWMDLTSGEIVEDTSIVAALGDGLLRRAANGGMTIDNDPVVPASCKAKVLALAASPQRIVVVCENPGHPRGTVAVFGPKLAVPTTHPEDYKDPLTLTVATSSQLCPQYADYCIDLATGSLTALPGKSPDVWARSGNFALVLDGDQTYVWDAATGKQRKFKPSSFPDTREEGIVVIDTDRYDWVRNKRIGPGDEVTYAVDVNGRVLVGSSSHESNTLPPGPLHWETR